MPFCRSLAVFCRAWSDPTLQIPCLPPESRWELVFLERASSDGLQKSLALLRRGGGSGRQLYVAARFTRRARTQTRDPGQNGCWGWRNIVAVRNAALHCEGGEEASLLKEGPWAQCLEVLVQILGCD